MSNDTKFIDGLIVKAPNEKAPDYVKARLSIKREELIAWLLGQTGEWINADIKEGQSGKWYAAVDNWKPHQGQQQGRQQNNAAPAQATTADAFDDETIPF